MSYIISDLRRKEQRIQEIRNQESRRQGQEDTLRAQLKSEFNLNTIEEANDQLSSINQEIAATEKNLQALNAELKYYSISSGAKCRSIEWLKHKNVVLAVEGLTI